MNLNEIEVLAKTHADNYSVVCGIVEELQAARDKIDQKYLPLLRDKVATAQASRAKLLVAVQDSKEQFEKPRTRVFHGIKVGFAKGKAKLEVADDAVAVQRLEKFFGPDAVAFIHIEKTPNKEALQTLTPAMLRSFGITVTVGEEAAIAKPVDSDLEKTIKALLKQSPEAA